jgi:hypothetical protein
MDDEQIIKRFGGLIPLSLFLGARAAIAYIIGWAALHMVLAMQPLAKYSQDAADASAILSLGIFCFLVIEGFNLTKER